MSSSVSARSAAAAANGPSLSNPERDQALRAALASQKTPTSIQSTQQLTKNGFVSGGAIAAAARAGTGKSPSNQGSGVIIQVREQRREGTLDRHASTETIRGLSVSPNRTAGIPSTSSVTYLAKPSAEPGPRQGSPSHIAAAIAAARSITPGEGKPELSRAQSRSPERKDESSIPATNALVKMFEARSSLGSKVEVKPITAAGPSIVLSPKPVRALSVRMSSGRDYSKDAQVASPRRGPVPQPSRSQSITVGTRPVVRTRSAESIGRKYVEPSLQSVSYRQTPPSRSPGRRPSAGDVATSARATAVSDSPSQVGKDVGSKPRQSQPLQSSQPGTPRPAPRQASSTRSITTQMLVPDEGVRAASVAKRSAHQAQHVRPQLNADSLADAIVASSLASSRAPSPHKASPVQPPLPPPPRKGHKALGMTTLFSNHSDGQSSSPRQISPGKPTTLKTTLRSTAPDEEGLSAVKSGGGGKLRKQGNMPPLKSIAMADRKLYEGVWAANRGILLTPTTAGGAERGQDSAQQARSDDVHGFVVRDIWSRSGLDRELLAQIWELVDGKENGVAKQSPHGTLSRQEFVVGMWLIDQALLGRKLPRSVPDEVWASLRVGGGLEFRR